MNKEQKCRCGADMEVVAQEKDYGDTIAIVHWCPSCGRLRRADYPLHHAGVTVEWKKPGENDE